MKKLFLLFLALGASLTLSACTTASNLLPDGSTTTTTTSVPLTTDQSIATLSYLTAGFLNVGTGTVANNTILLANGVSTKTNFENEIDTVNVYFDRLKSIIDNGVDGFGSVTQTASDNPDYQYQLTFTVNEEVYTIYYNVAADTGEMTGIIVIGNVSYDFQVVENQIENENQNQEQEQEQNDGSTVNQESNTNTDNENSTDNEVDNPSDDSNEGPDNSPLIIDGDSSATTTIDPADQAAADAVIALIDSLPDVTSLTINDQADLTAARTAYDALTLLQQELVTNYQTLVDLEAQMVTLTTIVDPADQAAADAVITLIDELPDITSLTLDDQADLTAARTAYDALTEVQQALVTNYQSLLDLEAQMVVLNTPVDPTDQAAADAVIALIDALPDVSSLTATDQTVVAAARTAYDALTEAQQALVTNYEELVNAEAQLSTLTVGVPSSTEMVLVATNGSDTIKIVYKTETEDNETKTVFNMTSTIGGVENNVSLKVAMEDGHYKVDIDDNGNYYSFKQNSEDNGVVIYMLNYRVDGAVGMVKIKETTDANGNVTYDYQIVEAGKDAHIEKDRPDTPGHDGEDDGSSTESDGADA